MTKQQPHGQPSEQPLTLERIVRDVRRQHDQAKYPGDLAADLGLGTTADLKRVSPRRVWWLPVFAASAAAVALAVGLGVYLASTSDENATAEHAAPPVAPPVMPVIPDPQDTQPTTLAQGIDATDDTPNAAPTPRPTAAQLARAIPPGQLDRAIERFDAVLADATQQADVQLSKQMRGRHHPAAPSPGPARLAVSLGSLPSLPPLGTHTVSLPPGQRLAVPSLSTLRKELL